jgi:hypothetical protein
MCATCYPKPVAETVVATRAPSRGRASTTRRGAPGRPLVSATPVNDVREQRIYHLTHVRNLPSILADGAVMAGVKAAVDISPPEARAERAVTDIPGVPDALLTEFVPFFLSPNAQLWQSIRAQEPHPRVSRDILGADAADFVLLVSTVRELEDTGREFVVADGNSEGSLTRYGITVDAAERLLRRLRADPEERALLEAELLVRDSLPLGSVSLIGVAHDKVRATVRDLLQASRFSPKVAVYPPWFSNEP